MAKKRTNHIIREDEIEIGPFELRLMLGESWKEKLSLYTNSFFCDCGDKNKKLVNYKSYICDLNDVILKGWCSSCKTIAVKYIETVERPGMEKVSNRIRKLNEN